MMQSNAMTPDWLPADQPLFCDRCLNRLHPGRGDLYIVRIEAVADPSPPEFTAEDLARDHRRELAEIAAQLEDLSAREAMDQVFRRLTIFLCGQCYRHWIENPTGR
jgi:hypothetical protein